MGSFFKKFIIKFRNIFRKASTEDVLLGLDIDIDKLYEDPNVAVKLGDRYAENSAIISEVSPKLHSLKNDFEKIQRIEKLSRKSKTDLENLARIYSETIVERDNFRSNIDKTPRDEYLDNYTETMEEVLSDMKSTEEHQQLVKMDMAYLESERDEIIYQKSRLLKTNKLLNNLFLFVLLIVFLAMTSILITAYSFETESYIVTSVAILVVIIATVWVYVFRRRVDKELSNYNKKLAKAISLLNKTKIKYINNKKLLDFQYKKYKVNSYYMLEARWGNYKKKIRDVNRFKNMNKSISSIMKDIDLIIGNTNLKDSSFIFDNIDYFMTAEGRKKIYQNHNEQINELTNTLRKAEKENSIINIVLTNYKSTTALNKKSNSGD